MNAKKINLLNKQGSKQFLTLNMKPFVKLTKKQHRSSARHNYLYGLEYKKRLYKQNLINNLTFNHFKPNIEYLKKFKPNQYYLSPYNNIVPLSSITKYSAFLNNSNLWSIQKQTTALKVFPQSSISWLYSSDKLMSSSLSTLNEDKIEFISKKIDINVNKKNKLWTAGFVRVRKLRQYYSKQLQSTNKLLYWMGYPSFKELKKIMNKIYIYNNSTSNVWSIITFLDSLWPNILIKSDFVYNSSASSNLIKQKKCRYNGLILKKTYSFCNPGDIIYKI